MIVARHPLVRVNQNRASINKRLPASINIGIINLAATFSSCLSRVSHPDCRATIIAYLNGEPQITDESPCVCRSIRAVAIWANDAAGDDQTRQRLLPFIHRAMGTATDDPEVLKPRVKHLLALIIDLAREAQTDAARESAEAAMIGAENFDGAVKQVEYFGLQAVKLASMAQDAGSATVFDRIVQFLDEALPAAELPSGVLIQRANRLLEAAGVQAS